MGVGYSASPLHRISYLEPVEDVKAETPPFDPISSFLLKTGAVWDGKPQVFRSPTIADVVRWRTRVSDKYRDQLDEVLFWDENSTFETSEDVATSADMLLRYTAAVLDLRGAVGVRLLVGTAKPAYSVLDAVFAGAERRGFGGRFPQLLLGATCWLPFKRHLIIEEPDWRGDVGRYGSLFRLSDELAEVRGFIADADPGATAWVADKGTPQDDVLAAAWQASDTVSRLCGVAVGQCLPLWTTG